MATVCLHLKPDIFVFLDSRHFRPLDGIENKKEWSLDKLQAHDRKRYPGQFGGTYNCNFDIPGQQPDSLPLRIVADSSSS